MPTYLRKTLTFILIIFGLLIFFIFGGANYIGSQLTSLSGAITAWVTINPLEVNVSAPAEVEIGKVFQAETKVINKGTERIENGEAEILLPSGLVLLGKDAVKKIGSIPAKKEKRVSWAVKGEEIGTYIIVVRVFGELRGESISVEDSTKVEVKLSLSRKKNLWQWLQDFLDFLR